MLIAHPPPTPTKSQSPSRERANVSSTRAVLKPFLPMCVTSVRTVAHAVAASVADVTRPSSRQARLTTRGRPTTRSTARVAGQPRWGSGASGGAGTVVPLHALRTGSDSARKATRLISNGHSRCEPGPFVTLVSGSDPAASSPDGRRSGSTRIDIRSLSANTRHRASTMDALVESVAASVRTRPTRAPQQIQSQMSKRISQFSETGQHQYPRHSSE